MNNFIRKNFPTYLRIHQQQKGAVFISALLTGVLLTFIGISLANVAMLQLRRTHKNVYVSNALLTAEAGIERGLYELNRTEDFEGHQSEIEFFDDDDQGKGVYETEVTSGVDNEKILTSVGRVYRSNGTLESERRVKVSLVGTASAEPSVYAGAGGLNLGGAAKISNSDVYVNGKITMSGAAYIGDDANPVNLYVANHSCPTGSNPGPTFPSLCTNTQPISMPDWGVTSIIGSVCATGQTQTKFPESQYNNNPPQIRAGASGGEGLIPGCAAPTVPMPSYDKDEHISRVSTKGTMSDPNYNCNTWRASDGFKRTWPDNLQIDGDVNIASSCDLTITGDVYITGSLSIGGGSTIRVAEELEGTMPTIVVEGTVQAGAGGKILANSHGSAVRIISFANHNNCHPSCTGTDLKKSQEIKGIVVDGGGQYPGSIFHAYWSTVKVGGSGLIGSAIGQVVDMSGAGNIVFGTNLSSGTTTWTIRSYQYDYE